MNRTNALVLCTALALPLGVVATAAESWSIVVAADRTDEGTIKSVDSSADSFVLTVGAGTEKKDITVRVNKDTKYMLDGKESTRDKALIAGNTARVTHSDNTASKVDASSPKKPS